MAVLVLKTKIKNLNKGDINSDNDNKYPSKDAKIVDNGCS